MFHLKAGLLFAQNEVKSAKSTYSQQEPIMTRIQTQVLRLQAQCSTTEISRYEPLLSQKLLDLLLSKLGSNFRVKNLPLMTLQERPELLELLDTQVSREKEVLTTEELKASVETLARMEPMGAATEEQRENRGRVAEMELKERLVPTTVAEMVRETKFFWIFKENLKSWKTVER